MRFRIIQVTLLCVAISLTSVSGAQTSVQGGQTAGKVAPAATEVAPLNGDAPTYQCGKDTAGNPIPCDPRPCRGRICPLIRILKSAL